MVLSICENQSQSSPKQHSLDLYCQACTRAGFMQVNMSFLESMFYGCYNASLLSEHCAVFNQVCNQFNTKKMIV